jgi:hypothetical protein
MTGDRLVQIMRAASKKPSSEETDLINGEITSVNPLKIWVDSRFEIDDSFNIILSALCKESPYWRGLKVGDVVRILRLNNGQLFYVLERKDGIL